MKITKNRLRDFNIINAHDLAKRSGGLMLVASYRPAENGRASSSAQWSVWRVGHQVDPNAHWQDHGSKVFTVSGCEQKEPQRLAAIKWASEKYGIDEWEKSPFGSYHPKGILAKATQQETQK